MTYFCSIGSQILYIFETHGIGQTPSSLERYLVFLFVTDANCGLCEINKKTEQKAAHGPNPSKK